MNTPTAIHYTFGPPVESPVVAIWDDNHNERSGYKRAFWVAEPNGRGGSTVIGYCSPGGSHRTVSACAAEIRRLYPDAKIYRNGKLVTGGK